MQKKTKNMVASVLALVGRPSQQKLSRKDLRLLIHNAVERYTAKAIKEREDWWTHIDDATVAYVANKNYFTFTLPSSVTEYKPMFVWYQPLTAARNTADWYEANLVSLESFPDESRLRKVIIAYYGNNFDGIGGLRVVMNITEAYAAQLRWRLQYRRFTLGAPAMIGTVPFPYEYASLIEYAVAEEAITMIDDNSERYMAYMGRRLPIIQQRRLELEIDFMDSVKRDPKARVITARPYNYRGDGSRNRSMPFSVEP